MFLLTFCPTRFIMELSQYLIFRFRIGIEHYTFLLTDMQEQIDMIKNRGRKRILTSGGSNAEHRSAAAESISRSSGEPQARRTEPPLCNTGVQILVSYPTNLRFLKG